MRRSYALLAPRGALVVYGTALALDRGESVTRVFVRTLGRILLWHVLPNGHRATFYNFWSGHLLRRGAFRRRLAADLTAVLRMVADGRVRPEIAARIPLERAADALTLAESGTTRGKVVLLP